MHPSTGQARYASPVARILWATGVIFLFGTLVDLAVLWFGQRQPGLQWEFVAVSNTAEAWPRLVLGLALLYMGGLVERRAGEAFFRFLGGATLLLGLGAGVVGAVAALNALTLLHAGSGNIGMVRAAAAKTLALCLLYFVLLVPLGAMGLRRPRP